MLTDNLGLKIHFPLIKIHLPRVKRNGNLRTLFQQSVVLIGQIASEEMIII